MAKSPYKMKAGKEGPMRKNFGSAFKKDTDEKKEAKITQMKMTPADLKKKNINPKPGVTYYMGSNGKMSTSTNVKK